MGCVDGGFSAGGAVWGGGVGAGGLSVCEDFRAGAVGGGVGFGSWAAVFLEAGSEKVSGSWAVEEAGVADGVVGGIGDGDVGVGGDGAEWAWGTEVGRGAGVWGVGWGWRSGDFGGGFGGVFLSGGIGVGLVEGDGGAEGGVAGGGGGGGLCGGAFSAAGAGCGAELGGWLFGMDPIGAVGWCGGSLEVGRAFCSRINFGKNGLGAGNTCGADRFTCGMGRRMEGCGGRLARSTASDRGLVGPIFRSGTFAVFSSAGFCSGALGASDPCASGLKRFGV